MVYSLLCPDSDPSWAV